MCHLEHWISFLVFGFCTIVLCCCLVLAGYFFGVSRTNFVKSSAYECGFKPFSFGYIPFDVHFYRVGILFLLFDVEILFLVP